METGILSLNVICYLLYVDNLLASLLTISLIFIDILEEAVGEGASVRKLYDNS